MKKLAVGVAIVLLALAAASAHAASADIQPQGFTDPAGDNGTAPDITALAVTNDASGQYEFDVAFGSDYGDKAQLFLYLDTDRNTSTGDTQQDGADYLVYDDHSSHSFEVDSWGGTDWTATNDSTASFTIASDNRSLQISINKSDLGGADSFNFFVASVDGASTADTGYFDDAPSGSGTFVYQLQQPLSLSIAGTTTLLRKKTHRLTVGIAVKRSDTNALVGGEDGTLACAATGGKARLKVVTKAFYSAGAGKGSAAVCQFALPKKHVPVVAAVTVTVDGVSVTKTVHTKS